MAVISVAQSGNWSATSTWTGGVLPSSTDTISVLAGKTLTVDGNYVCAGGTCATGSKIALAAGCSLETTGLLTMGTSTLPRTSYLEFGAGSELKLNGGDLQLWACGVTTNGTTKSSPAKISGSSNITCSANTGRGYFNCTYLLFVLTGTVLVRWGNVASSFTDNSSYRFYNCTFGATSFDFGSATIPVSGFAFNYCDFRESTPTFYFSGNSGESEIKYTTMSAATVKTFTLRCAGVTTDFTGSIFNNMYLSLQTKNAANLGMSSVFAALTSAPSGQTLIGIEGDATSGNAVSDASYYYVSTSNLRVLNLGSAATASNTTAKHEVKNSVLELPVSDGGNPIVIGPHKTEITRNLMLGYLLPWASRAYAVGGTAQGLDVVRNTQHCPAGDIAPALVSFEQGDVDYPAPINAHSNLSIWATTPFSSSYASLACERSSVVNDSLNIVGHNATYGAGTGPRYVASSITTDLSANDLVLSSAPTFVDSTRNLASWGAANGADGTAQGAINLLLARNGYDAATKSQNGTASSVTPADLVSWVRAGFAPTTAALDGTGYLGVDIGAMDVASAAVAVEGPAIITAESTLALLGQKGAVGPATVTASASVGMGGVKGAVSQAWIGADSGVVAAGVKGGVGSAAWLAAGGFMAGKGPDVTEITADEVARVVRAAGRMKTVTAAARAKQVRYAIS